MLGEELFREIGEHGEWHCLTMGNWVLVERWLTPEEAAKQYGKVTAMDLGPRGGFRSVTYGATTLYHRALRPNDEIVAKFRAKRKLVKRKAKTAA